MDIFERKQEIMEMATLGALATLRLQNPAFDEVSLREAYKISGDRRWLDYHIKKGNIKGEKRGNAINSKIFFSRLEIAALKKSEREIAKIISKTSGRIPASK